MIQHTDTLTVEELLDREKIRDNLARYCRGMDRQSVELVRSTYWPDAWDDHGTLQCGANDFIKQVIPMWPTLKMSHTLGQSYIEIDGHLANVETYFLAYHRIGQNLDTKDVFVGGRYNDKLEKRGAQWKIRHRTAVYDWVRDVGDSFAWDKSLIPFGNMPEHNYGATRTDFTWRLFAGEELERAPLMPDWIPQS